MDRPEFVVRVERDEDAEAPWDGSDLHGVVSGWTNRKKRAGERVLNLGNGPAFRYYDFKASCKIAREKWIGDGPIPEGKTRRQYAAELAEADYEHLVGWCSDHWYYVTITVQLGDEQESIGGVESFDAAGIERHIENMQAELLGESAPSDPDPAVGGRCPACGGPFYGTRDQRCSHWGRAIRPEPIT